jgi:4-amino-4-deoxy-L-arabinose transferase-like glycosyltransferase
MQVGLLFLTFWIRAVRVDQPIVENYVGRQIPTAMVARNLERGSGFFRPQLDTAPLPNYFMVEPPLYEELVVGFQRATGWPLTWSGRWISALAMTLAAWGLFGLVRRREGVEVAMGSLAVFAIFPVTIRYGRAFQPDALMLGLVLAGLCYWDEYEAGGGRLWLLLGSVLLAAGLAVKVTAAYVLVPLFVGIVRTRRAEKMALAGLLLIPALLWYIHAASVIGEGVGSRASVDNQAIWLRTLSWGAFAHGETVRAALGHLVVRSFTPLGLLLAVVGLCLMRPWNRFWLSWAIAALAMLAALAAKLHHEYYFLALAPVVAVGVGRSLARWAEQGRVGKLLAWGAGCGLVVLAGLGSASTWRTPAEWAELPTAGRLIAERVPADAWVAAPEAVLFAADRRGCRLEFARRSAQRAAGEWGATLDDPGPLALVEFYKDHGARFVADVGDAAAGPDADRLALHESIRRRYNVLVDRPALLLAELTPRRGASHGDR